ncbi:MAG: DUF2249 domain-containing protein [Leptonema sp. (in: bacteria)]
MDFTNRTIKELDVSHLPAPEPFYKILETLLNLKEKEVLKVTHRKEPFLLYEELKKMGFFYRTKQISENQFEIYIYK